VTQATVESAIDRDELAKLTLDLCDISSPAGQEAAVGNFVFDWMKKEGFAPGKIFRVRPFFMPAS
jgi:hypothetical protein